ncbi:MAG: exodeoxyribonuclease III [Candidatus Kapabacteria bacterium]|jgi:exodeoxyribonuclease-3|nr:exodeoxyribonuclease III [Candidatus Kapabacteria bacterium]
MKIISWNINGYRSVSGQNPSKRFGKITQENKLFKFIEDVDPDIICMQETKADVSQINEELRSPKGYHDFWHSATSKKGYSGVLIFSKKEPVSVNYKLGIEKFDVEGRIIEAEFGDFILFNVYFPKGYADNERLDYKMEFYDKFFKHCDNLRAQGKKLIVCGDYNTAHKEIDLARPKTNTKTSGFMPLEREALDNIVESGYTDCFRHICNEPDHYSWWSQRGRARENNVGWRIDYHFVSNDLLSSVTDAYHLPETLGSDHCPIVLELDI